MCVLNTRDRLYFLAQRRTLCAGCPPYVMAERWLRTQPRIETGWLAAQFLEGLLETGWLGLEVGF